MLSQISEQLGHMAEWLPWVAVIIVYIGETLKQIWLTRSLNGALTRAQDAAHAPAPSPASAPQPAPIPAPAPAIPAPGAPSGPFADAPAWFQWALHEVGTREEPGNRGAAIRRYVELSHCGAEGEPWCSIFACAALESVGVPGTRSPSSKSFCSHPNFVRLQGPALGAIAVFWRGSRDSGLGHVGFYRGEDASRIWTLGGNENDMVQIEALPKSSSSFGLLGYWWPKSVPLPKSGAVVMPSGSPVHVQGQQTGAPTAAPAPANGLQQNIVATMFGGQKSAYGGAIDDNVPGVALPFHFTGPRPNVRVSNAKTGASVDCPVVDVGPWNTNDPYWQTGARPEAESGTDLHNRHTNGAGIDLTFAAAKAIGIDGKGLVDWQFLEQPQTT
jgi:uncharacterized protein (TIGR02594 family)